MSLKSQKFFLAKITFLNRKDSADTLEVWVGTRTFEAGQAWSGSPWIYGSILGIDGLGQAMGEVLPRVVTGSITLNTTRGSLDHHRSIVDLLEKYTVIKQPVEVYSFSKRPDFIGDIADRESEFVGECSNVEYSPSGRTLTLAVETREISSETPLRRITREQCPDAPDRSIGRYLPIVIGEAEVVAYPVGTQSSFSNVYYIASRFTLGGGTLTPTTVQNYYYKDQNIYNEVFMWTSSGFIFYKMPVQAQTIFAKSTAEYAAKFILGIPKYITTGGRIKAALTGAGGSHSAAPAFTFEIYKNETSQGLPSSNPIASAEISATTQSFSANTSTTFDVRFKKPIAIDTSENFYVGRISDRVATGHVWQVYSAGQGDPNVGGLDIYLIIFPFDIKREENPSRAARNWYRESSLLPGVNVEFDGVKSDIFNDGTALDVSFDAVAFSLSQNSDTPSIKQGVTSYTLITTPESCDISELDLIVNLQGIKDNASGTITGSAGSVIERGDHAVKLIWYLMKGSLTDLDTTTFSPGSYIGNVSGATEGRRSYREILSDILYNTSSKLLPRRNGKLALWSFGVPQTPSYFLTENDCRLEGWTEDAAESLVNRVEISFDRRAIPLNVEDLQSNATVNNAQTYSEQDDESIEFFGTRDLADGAINLNWIRDESQAQRWARFVLDTYSAGAIYVTFTVPFWKDNFREIELYDIISLNHIDIPSEYGSQSSNVARTTEPGSTGSYSEGFVFRHSKSVFLRIVSRSPRFTSNEAEATITFTGKVLRQREFK